MAISQAQLESLYLAYFGRPADFDGLVFYTSNPNFDIWSVAAAFSASPESQALYGSGVSTNFISAATINAIYQNLFNRDAEPAGLAYWAEEVASGRLSAAGAAYGILLGAQNEDAIAVANKLAASSAFTAALDTAPEIIGYTGDGAAAAARAWLHTVTSDAATLAAAIAGVDAAVAAVVAVGGTIGPSYTLTTGVDTINITDATTINTISSVIAAAGSTLTVGDSIDGNGKTIVQVAMAGATAVPFTTLKDVKSIELINADSASVSIQAAGWTNVGEINMKSGLAGGAAFFDNLQAGVDLSISVAGSLSASYTDGMYAGFFLDAGDSASLVDGNVTVNIAADNSAGFNITSSGDLALGNVTLTAGSSASFSSTDIWASGDLTVGNVSVNLADGASMDELDISASGDVTVGDVSLVMGDFTDSNDIDISSTGDGAVTVGNVNLTIGDNTDTTSHSFTFDVRGGDVTVGNIAGVMGDSGLLNVSISGTGGDVNVGSVGLVVGDSGSLDFNADNWNSAGNLTVGFVAVEVGVSSSLDIEVSATESTAEQSVGALSVGGLSMTLGNDAVGSVDILHSVTATLTGSTSAETIGTMNVGDITMNLGADATLDVEITQAMYGSETTSTTVGDVTIGDMHATLAIGASVSLDVLVTNSNSGDVGNVTIGDTVVTLDDGATYSATFEVYADKGVGTVTVGGFDATLGVDADAYFYVSVTADDGDVEAVSVGDISFQGGQSASFYGYEVSVSADGDIGSVTVGDINVDLDANAVMSYGTISISATGDIGSVTVGDITVALDTSASFSYEYLDVYAAGDIGSVTQGDLDVTLGKNASFNHPTYNYVSAYASGTLDSLEVGDISAAVGTSANFYYWVYGGGFDGLGDMSVGDIAITSEGGDQANLWIGADSTGGDIGSVTIGDMTLVATGSSTVSVTVDIDALGELGSLNLGNVDISSSVSSSVDVNIMTTATLGTAADITIDAFTLRGSGAYQFDVGFTTYAGDITLNNVNVAVSATAPGLYDLTMVLSGVANAVANDVALGTVNYADYVLTGTSSTGAVIDVSGYVGDITIIGSVLDDTITDNTETNVITGGDGADTFNFVAMNADNVGLTDAKADVITDFEYNVDQIVLDTGVAPTADEYFEGTAASFSAFLTLAKAQLTSSPEDNVVAVQVGSDVYVAVDMDGGDKIDTVIKLVGASTTQLDFGDFAFV